MQRQRQKFVSYLRFATLCFNKVLPYDAVGRCFLKDKNITDDYNLYP
jgi:hypothetical protein